MSTDEVAGKHMPCCNDQCEGDGHHMLASFADDDPEAHRDGDRGGVVNLWDGHTLADAIGRQLETDGFYPFGIGVPFAARRAACEWFALLIEAESPHEADDHAEGTCDVCDYTFALGAMLEEERTI